MSQYLYDGDPAAEILKGAAGGAGGGSGAGTDPGVPTIIIPDDEKPVDAGGFYLPAEAVAMIDSRNTGPSVLLLLAVGFGAYLLTLAINPSLPSFGGGRSSSRRPSRGSKPSWSR